MKDSKPVDLKSALHAAIAELDSQAVGSPRLNAETLLMFTLNCDRAYLYAHPERELTADEAERYRHAISERASGKPSQYITGHQEFFGLDLIVSPEVLIPRPETEHSVELILELAAERPGTPLKLADIGTGSGCIALALASKLPAAEVIATDISAAALEIARINAERLELAARVKFWESDLLAGFDAAEKFDFIVCNPPYVSELKPETVQRQVREHEPRIAVFSGPSGLEAYQRLVPQAREHLRPGGWLVMEIGYSIEEAVRALLKGWSEVRVRPDLQGIPRVVAARA